MTGHRNILFISDHSDPLASLGGEESGGQNVYVHELASRLAKKGHTVHVLTRHNCPKKKKKEKSQTGYTVFRVPVGPEGFLPKEEFAKYLSEFSDHALRMMERESYDIIHSHYWLSGIAGLAVQTSFSVPLVHTFHSLGKVKHRAVPQVRAEYQVQREEAEMDIARQADCLLVESTDERRTLLRLYEAEAEKITVIPAGVNTAFFKPGEKIAARNILGIREENVLLYVGRFVVQKGIPTLLQAYAQLLNSLTDDERKKTLLILAGGDLGEQTAKQAKIQKRIHNLITSLHLTSSIRIAGQIEQENLPTYYQAADFTIVPSRYEPFGIVPIESMACGTPVIASFVGGMKTTVRNLVTGLHARPKISSDFAHKMRIFLRNPALRDECGRQAREHVEQEFGWETISDRVLTCYNSTIAHG